MRTSLILSCWAGLQNALYLKSFETPRNHRRLLSMHSKIDLVPLLCITENAWISKIPAQALLDNTIELPRSQHACHAIPANVMAPDPDCNATEFALFEHTPRAFANKARRAQRETSSQASLPRTELIRTNPREACLHNLLSRAHKPSAPAARPTPRISDFSVYQRVASFELDVDCGNRLIHVKRSSAQV